MPRSAVRQSAPRCRQIEWASSAVLRDSHEPHVSHGIISEFGNVKAVTRRSTATHSTADSRRFRGFPSTGPRRYKGHPEATTASPVKAILCTRPGTPDDLTLADIPEPVAGPGEVVVKVGAVGLNFYDTL